jgi:Fur family ferric uptake transcriptional regulator
LLDRLREVGLRATTQRRVIVETLLDQPAHITAEDLTAVVNERYPEVHTATVYRTLEVLESLGVLYRLDNGHAPTQWHLTERSHQHLVCDTCGAVEEVSSPAFARLASALARDHGFQADLRHVAIAGVCSTCAATTAPRAPRDAAPHAPARAGH